MPPLSDTDMRHVAISVVIPAFNAEDFLGACIESVLEQTKCPEEIIVVDDGSTDGTFDIARTYSQKYPALIRVLQHEGGANKGVSASRNLAILAARCDYIAFIDADDVWQPHKLELQSRSIAAHPEVVLFSAKTSFIDRDGEPTTLKGFVTSGRGRQGIQRQPFESLLAENKINATTCIVRRDAIIAAGLFPEEVRYHEDWLMWLKLSYRGAFYFDDAIVGAYRQHEGSKLLGSQTGRVGPQREAALMSALYSYLNATYPERRLSIEKYIRFSIGRVLLRARSLSCTLSEMRGLRDLLFQYFPSFRSRISAIFFVLVLIPAPILSLLRVVRRSIVKV